MININLLPWREEKRQRNKRRFLIEGAVCALVILIVIISIHFSYSKKIHQQNSRNTILENKVRSLTAKIQTLKNFTTIETTLKKQINTLHALEYSRYQTITLLKEITLKTPKGIHLSEMSRKENTIVLKGSAVSLLLITQLIKQIGESKEIIKPILSSIMTTSRKDGTKVTRFELSMQLKPYQMIYKGGP